MNCNFYEGIDTCKEQKCDKNIMGMCTKKGSKNYPDVPHRTNFERIKLMNIDEMAELISTGNVCCQCVYENENCTNKSCREGHKKWLLSDVEE